MKTFIKTLSIITVLLFVVMLTITIVRNVKLEQNCTGHLKRASDANTVELAIKELDIAIDYLEKNNLTTGYTSVLWTTPDEDIEFFYNNIKTSKSELESLPENASRLEKTNTLMKLRETLCDEDKYGTVLTYPNGLSRYPYNRLFCYMWIVVLVFSIFWLLTLLIELS